MKFPWSLIFKPLGGISIDRSPKKPGEKRKSTVEAMADLFTKHKNLVVLVTPEGTRSYREEWKTGFYHVAKLANVPICLGYLNFEKKQSGVGSTVIQPTESLASGMKKIMEFYKDIPGKYPEKFSVDKRYA